MNRHFKQLSENKRPSLKWLQGFTLIELMITLVIFSLLALLSYPSYQSYLLRSRRLDAKIGLMKNIVGNSPDGFYQIKKIVQSPTEYTLIAIPIGSQAADYCGSFTLTSTHIKGAAQADCW